MYQIEKFNNNGMNVTRIINISKDELDLDKTLKCGQAFRWNKVDNITWCGVIGQNVVLLANMKFSDGEEGIATNLDIDNAKCLIDYLDLNISYTDEISKLKLDEFAVRAYNKGKGIHILRQDLFEMIITFLMSQFNSMRNITNIVEKLSKQFGNKIKTEFNGKVYERYSFPTLEQLKDITEEQALSCSIGLRVKYLLPLLKRISNNPEILDKLRDADYNTAMKILMQFSGIGEKVANCICLFGLHHIQAFPVDIHIQRLINEEYNGNINVNNYGSYAGIIQQYMYYYKAFK